MSSAANQAELAARRPGRAGLAITKLQTDRIKGAAILLMLVHHLFGLPGLIQPGNGYLGLAPGVPLEYWLGRFGKISVCLFLFLSGYGLAARTARTDWRDAQSRVLSFALSYWFYLAIALAVGGAFFQQRLPNGSLRFPADIISFVRLMLGLGRPLVYEWWFVQTYVLLIALSPFLLRAAGRGWLLFLGSCGAFVAGSFMDLIHINPPLVMFSNVLIWQQPFVAGMLIVRHDLFDRTGAYMSSPLSGMLAALMLAGFATVEIAMKTAMTPYLIVMTPLFVLLVQKSGVLAKRGAMLAWLGRMSMPLWLVHPLLCYYFWQDLVFAPGQSLLIFMWLLILTLAIAVPLERLRKWLLQHLTQIGQN